MLINRDNLETLFAGFKTTFNEGLSALADTRSRVSMQVPSSTSEEKYGWLKNVPNVREWLGDRVVHSFALDDYQIKNKDFELTISVSANAIKDDRYGVFGPQMRLMGESVAAHREQLVWGLLTAGFNTPCYDGKYFFDTDHPVLDKDGNETVIANTDGGEGNPWFLIDDSRMMKPIIYQVRQDYEFMSLTKDDDERRFWRNEYTYGVHGRENVGYGFWQVAWGSKQALNEINYESARSALSRMTGDYGRKLGLKGRLLVVGSSLERAGLRIVRAQLGNGGESNPWWGTADLLVVPWLD